MTVRGCDMTYMPQPPLIVEGGPMGCVTVCGVVEGGAVADAAAVVLAALAVAVLLAVAAAAVSVVLGALGVVVPVFLAALIPLAWVTWRLVVHGSPAEVFRRHRRVRVRAAARQTALPAGSSLRAIEAPKPAIRGTVLDDIYERTEAR